MLYRKKISFDFLHLALIMALVRLGPEILWSSQWSEPLEVADIGSTLVRRPYYPSWHMRTSRYTRLKTLDSVILSEITYARDRSYFLSSSGVIRSNIIAYYSDTPSAQASTEQRNEECRVNVESSDTGGASGEQPEEVYSSPPQSMDNLFSPGAIDLSPEDMDLIEILWKQDIDLGVSRDAFNPHENRDLEKLKTEPEFSKASKDHDIDHNFKGPSEFKQENASPCNESEACNYVIDSETGEHVIQEPKLNEAKSDFPLEQSLLSLEGFDEFSLFPPNGIYGEHMNLSKEFLTEEDNEALDSFDPDDLAAQIEKLENMMMNTDSGINETDFDIGSDMYPSMEEYWQDISTTLPLCVTNQGCVIPRPNRPYSVASDEHSAASTSSDVTSRSVGSNDAFAEALLQNVSLTQRAPEVNSSFAFLPPLLGPTSLGCAVASSIATLTNDTDPMPDAVPINSSAFGLDLPEMLPANQTAIQSANETLLTELLLDEDLQLMDAASAAPSHFEGPSRSVSLMRIFDKDPDSNDTASSLDCNENKRTKLEELTSASCTGKELIYGNFRYPSNQFQIDCGLRQVETSPNNLNYGMGMHSSFRGNYSCFQHNHTYHLPFTSGNNVPKPVTRDKEKHFRYDNENNRDEKRAKALQLPITICEIINLAIDEFNEKLSKYELTEPQLTLIRDIRRRGKNKVAAQNCRKRKMDQINTLQQDLGLLHDERLQLESERTHLLHQRRSIRDKYSKLCQLVFQSSASNPPSVSNSTPSNHRINSATSDTISPESNNDLDFNQGVRVKKKMGKKS